MEAYLDDYNLISILFKKEEVINTNLFYLNNELMEIISFSEEANYNKLLCKYKFPINFSDFNYINNTILLKSGSIIRTERFINEFTCNEKLGFIYSKEKTIFRIFSPLAHKIKLLLNNKEYYLENNQKGLWEITIFEDCNDYSYKYYCLINSDSEYVESLDPYGNKIKKGFNIVYNYNYPFQYKKNPFTNPVIYEVNIRDFTNFYTKRGTYLDFIKDFTTKNGHISGFKHLNELGITHVQIMPTFEFMGVENNNYNWGYNPISFFSISTHYKEQDECIEFSKMIDEIHKEGLNVVLDVVYNHIYDYKQFPYEILIPGYSFRHNEFGIMTEVSGCKNDLATERPLIRKLIIDSIDYLYNKFNIDGIRLDLMGLIDINLINEVRSKYPKDFLIYGEGWNMPSTLPEEDRASIKNQNKMEVSHFNDYFRDCIRGNIWNKEKGYALGNNVSIKNALLGSPNIFSSSLKSINYIECHDNYTFYDYMSILNIDNNRKKDYQKLANSLVIFSKGIPFIHSGQEFLRTKNNIENTYNKPDSINRINWNLLDEYNDVSNELRTFIKLRKKMKYEYLEVIEYSNYVLFKVDNISLIFKNNYDKILIDNLFEIEGIGCFVYMEGKIWNSTELSKILI